MTKKELIEYLRELKQELLEDGFIIEGVFGSYARDEANESSDIDILYSINSDFLNKYSGFIAFKKLSDIKKYLSKKLKKDIDLAPKNNLSKSAKKYILKEVIYV